VVQPKRSSHRRATTKGVCIYNLDSARQLRLDDEWTAAGKLSPYDGFAVGNVRDGTVGTGTRCAFIRDDENTIYLYSGAGTQLARLHAT